MTEVSLRIGHWWSLLKLERWFSSHQQPITLPIDTLPHPPITLSHPIMASNNNNNNRNLEEEVESSAAPKKRLRFSHDDNGDDSLGKSEEETQEGE
jgi:hypothetical protein